MLRERTFEMSDQQAFAQLSGDHNPLHVDDVAARRLLFGRPVVHGVHTLLWALDAYLANGRSPVGIRSLEAFFLKPSGVGQKQTLEVESDKWPEVGLVVAHNGVQVTRIRVTFDDAPPPSHDVPQALPVEGVPAPSEVAADDLAQLSGEFGLYVDVALSAQLFPNIKTRVPRQQLAMILASTRLVGMRCPGLHSVYSELKLQPGSDTATDTLRFRVQKVHKRFGLVQLGVDGPGWSGEIRAFLRPPPTYQKTTDEMVGLVNTGEFRGQRALIIGGSRGLGEVTAKLLAAGGADVHLTYYKGEAEANTIVAEARALQKQVTAHAYDVLNANASIRPLLKDDWQPTHWYYFATPFISPGLGSSYSDELFDDFYAVYVAAFERLFRQLYEAGVQRVLYPSTVFLDKSPGGMLEYIAAKRAGESLCRFLTAEYNQATIHMPRLPRMVTDQTASIVPVVSENPDAIMLRELRTFQKLAPSESI